ncbi:MAG: hypothetical protein JWO67_7405 [Streptosporangiaceae bacterium]|nr:hypothetical protein [Streptosporangiaceae bacterium]
MSDDMEPTLAATRAAAESVRTANHAAYHAPRGDTGNIYDRTGALVELLGSTEQIARVLGQHADRLKDAPGLFSDDGRPDPDTYAERAAARLHSASVVLDEAASLVNAAWSELSHLGVRPDAP